MSPSALPLLATEIDDKIESAAKSSYVFKTYLGDDVKIDSDEGVVTLKGKVEETSHITLAEDTVSSLPGVIRVDNELVLKEEGPLKNSDAWLVTKVKTTLLFHRNVSSMTTVSADNGVITLSGEADSLAEKELTGEYAMDIEGVSKVNNAMTIAAMPKEKTTKIANDTRGVIKVNNVMTVAKQG